jgi:hypothetical protein
MTLQTIVNVQITKATAALSRVGFGTPLLLVTHEVAIPDAKIYSDPADMLTDGFTTTDNAYLMALALTGQELNVPQFVVGKRNNQPLRSVNLIPVASPKASTLYRLLINGTRFDFTTDTTPTVAEITAGLAAAVQQAAWAPTTAYVVGDHVRNGGNVYIATTGGTSAGAGGPTGTGSGIVDGTVVWDFQGVEQNVRGVDNTTDMDVQSADTPGGSATAGIPFTLETDRTLWLTIKDETTDAGIAADLQAVRDINDDWYGVTGDWFDELTADALSTVIETLQRIHVWGNQDTDVLDAADTTDAFSNLNAKAFERSGGIWHSTPHEGWPAAAWIGSLFPTDPGSATWKFKTLTGVAADSFTGSEAAALLAKKANNYVRVAGLDITQEGVTHQGEFFDTTRGLDFVAQRIAEDVFLLLKTNPKIPFTDAGVAAVQSVVDSRLQSATAPGGGSGQIFSTDPAPVVTVPAVADVDAVDKANRLLRDVNFTATLAGAVHNVEVNGRVSI